MIHATFGNPRRKTKSVRMPPASEASDTPQRRSHANARAHTGGVAAGPPGAGVRAASRRSVRRCAISSRLSMSMQSSTSPAAGAAQVAATRSRAPPRRRRRGRRSRGARARSTRRAPPPATMASTYASSSTSGCSLYLRPGRKIAIQREDGEARRRLDPASTMPLDSTPISFAGSRFATTTTFLPDQIGRRVVLGDPGQHGAAARRPATP